MLTKQQKIEAVKDLSKNFFPEFLTVFLNFQGLNNEELQNLRKKLKKEGVYLKVAKKTLLNLIFKKKKIDFDPLNLEGEIAVAFSQKDDIDSAKIIYNFTKENEKLKILGGIYQNKEIDLEEVINLAKLPSREELLAKLAGTIFNPISGLINVLKGNFKGLICILSQVKS